MKTSLPALVRIILLGGGLALLSACATNPNAPPDPGSKKWYQQRMAEIETAKTNGELTEEQYLKLKNEADATRARRLDAMYRNNSADLVVIGVRHHPAAHH